MTWHLREVFVWWSLAVGLTWGALSTFVVWLLLWTGARATRRTSGSAASS
jgi:hypothetical protein